MLIADPLPGFGPPYVKHVAWTRPSCMGRVWRCERRGLSHAAGGRVGVARDLRCVHDAGGTQTGAGTPTKSSLYYYFNCRNRLVFAARNLAGRDRLRWALHSPRYAQQVVLRGGRRQLLRPWTCVLPAVRGTLSGLRTLLVGVPAAAPRPATPQVGAPSGC